MLIFFFFFCISFATFFIWSNSPLTSFVYISWRHSERGQVKLERDSPWCLSCHLSRLQTGSTQKFMSHTPKRSSPPTTLAQTGSSDLTHRRAANLTLPPYWQLRGFVLLTVTKFVSLSHRWCDQGRQKEDSEQSVRLFVYCYFYPKCLCPWYLRFSSRPKCRSHMLQTPKFDQKGILFPPSWMHVTILRCSPYAPTGSHLRPHPRLQSEEMWLMEESQLQSCQRQQTLKWLPADFSFFFRTSPAPLPQLLSK